MIGPPVRTKAGRRDSGILLRALRIAIGAMYDDQCPIQWSTPCPDCEYGKTLGGGIDKCWERWAIAKATEAFDGDHDS